MNRVTKLVTKLTMAGMLLVLLVAVHAQQAQADGQAPASPLDAHWASYIVWAAVLGLAALALRMLQGRLDSIERTLQGVASTQAMQALEQKLEKSLIDHQRAQEERLKQYFRLAGRIRRVEDRCLLIHGAQPGGGLAGRGTAEDDFGEFEDGLDKDGS